jgi:pyruvate dehydrogenase E2 component (dihydrolipoamide acetyltransferase)
MSLRKGGLLILAENDELIKLNTLRKTMINNLNKSINIAAQSTVVIEINMSKFIKAKETLIKDVKKETKIKLSYLPMLIYEISRVLTRHSSLNSTLDFD